MLNHGTGTRLNYMRELAKQRQARARAMNYWPSSSPQKAFSMSIFHVLPWRTMKERAPPIDWTALGRRAGGDGGIGIVAQAPHRTPAKVFLDFVAIARRAKADADSGAPGRARRSLRTNKQPC